MAKPNRTRSALLGFLSWGPMSGYDLRQIIDGSISNFWSESYGRIYPMLAQLTREGLASCEKTRSEGGRPRNVYSLTLAGREALDEWLGRPVAVSQPPRDERLLKLFFGARVRPAMSIQLVEAFEAELEETTTRYAETRERLEAAKEAPIDQKYWLMTLRFGELRLEAELKWCQEVLVELRAFPSD
jgi:PadR family transcriptional regulator AphA